MFFFAPEKRPTVVCKTISIFFIFTLKRPRDNLLFPRFPNKTDLHQALRRHLQKQKQPSRFMRWYSSDAKIISCLSHWGFWLKQSHCRKLSEGFSGLDERGRRASTLTWTELVNGNWVKMKKKMLSMCIWSHPSALLPFHILGLKKNNYWMQKSYFCILFFFIYFKNELYRPFSSCSLLSPLNQQEVFKIAPDKCRRRKITHRNILW